MADVARRAGVSTAAVSKVLRNAYGVSPGMASRVRIAMEDLGYRPHAAARGLRGQTFTLGLLLPDLRNPFFADILEGVVEHVGAVGYKVLLSAAVSDTADETAMAEAMVDRSMDGLVLVAPSMPRTDVELMAEGIPTVVFGHHDRGYHFDTVADDDVAGAALVIDHLAGLGHRRIAHTSAAHVREYGWDGPDQVRCRGYEQAMRAHGLEPQLAITSFTEEGGYQAGLRLLSRTDRPTAVFAGADIAAFGVMRAAAELGLRIPQDLSLVGYDNSRVAAFAPIQLTSVDQHGRELGALAARLLLERIAGRSEPRMITRPPRLVARGSSTAIAP